MRASVVRGTGRLKALRKARRHRQPPRPDLGNLHGAYPLPVAVALRDALQEGDDRFDDAPEWLFVQNTDLRGD